MQQPSGCCFFVENVFGKEIIVVILQVEKE